MSDFGCVVVVEPIGFNGALDLRSERKRVKDDTKDSGLQVWKNRVSISWGRLKELGLFYHQLLSHFKHNLEGLDLQCREIRTVTSFLELGLIFLFLNKSYSIQ